MHDAVRVLSVASEIYPIIKTGGLADVAGALPMALAAEGVEVRTLVPGYPAVLEALDDRGGDLIVPNFFGGPARLLAGACGELDLFVLDAPHLFARPGNPYLTPDGKDWPDNALRFAALARGRPISGSVACRPSCPMSSMPMIGRRGWRPPICTTASVRGRAR